jgi:hypothetical protein
MVFPQGETQPDELPDFVSHPLRVWNNHELIGDTISHQCSNGKMIGVADFAGVQFDEVPEAVSVKPLPVEAKAR